MGLFRKGITRIIAKFCRTDFIICSHFRERKTPTYSQINMAIEFANSVEPYEMAPQ